MISLSLRRPVTVLMVVLAIGVFGVISYSRLGRDLLPDIAYPSLTIKTEYEGAAPQEVEEFISKPLEAALATVPGQRSIQSVSREGLSLITLGFNWNEDMQIATLNVREKLDAVRFQPSFPEQADRPNILKWDPSSKPIAGLAVSSSGDLVQLRESVEELIKPRLEQIEGVALAQLTGEVERVLDVEISREKLQLYGLTLTDVGNAISGANATIAGGSIKKGRYRYALRTLGEFEHEDQIAEVVIARKNGSLIRVGDVAKVQDTIKDRTTMALLNGKESVGLLIYKESGANTLDVTFALKQTLAQLKREFNAFSMTVAFEDAKFISQALNNVWVSILFGGLFAFFVLIVFLGDLKSPFFIFTSIPIALVATIALMYFFGLTLNIMSLGGLALGVGMLVDNSIVVLENIYRHRHSGMTPMKAAFQGAREVAAPVAASTFTTIAVFFPIVYLKGIAGALFGEQAMTVTLSLLSSLAVSLTVLPLLTTLGGRAQGNASDPTIPASLTQVERSMDPRGFWYWRWWEFCLVLLSGGYVLSHFKQSWWAVAYLILGVAVLPFALFLLKWLLTLILSYLIQLMALGFGSLALGMQWVISHVVRPLFEWVYGAFNRVYHRVLVFALDRKALILTLALLLLAGAIASLSSIKRELMPKSATGQFTITLRLEAGSSLETTAALVTDLENLLAAQPAVALIFSQIGENESDLADMMAESGLHKAKLTVRLKDAFNNLEVVRQLIQLTQAWAPSARNLQLSFTESESSFEDLLAAEGGQGVVIQLEAETFDQLKDLNEKVMKATASVPGLQGTQSTYLLDYPQILVHLNRENIYRYGFNLEEVGSILAGGMRGELATEYKEFDKKVDVRVRFSQADRVRFDRVLSTQLTSTEGITVPLSELVTIEQVKGLREILRMNQRRVALVSASLVDRKISEIQEPLETALAGIPLPEGVAAPRIMGEQEGIRQSFGQLGFALLLSIALVYMIMAGQFESLKLPFIVILTVPMGLIGTTAMLVSFDLTLNIMSLIGVIVLSGIVVNDAIVKVDFINAERLRGASVRQAVLLASEVRLRPILMTTATTVLGLAPMAFNLIGMLSEWEWLTAQITHLDQTFFADSAFSLAGFLSKEGSEIQKPLALVVIGGLSVATALTLILIPVLYESLSGVDVHLVPEGVPHDGEEIAATSGGFSPPETSEAAPGSESSQMSEATQPQERQATTEKPQPSNSPPQGDEHRTQP
jgi:HAE1 family hydrophobic/amphiphilic exporter-1